MQISSRSPWLSVTSTVDRQLLRSLVAVLLSERTLSAFRPKTSTPQPHRAMSYTLLYLMTPRTGTPSSPFPESVFLQSEQPCGDQRPQQSGALTKRPPLTGHEPNRIAEDWDYRHFTGDGQLNTRIHVSDPCPSTSRS